MTTGQFQLESDIAAGVRVIPSRRITPNALNAGMSSLLIGLGLRSFLADSEKEFLDQLAPYHYISFLIHGDEYAHPEGVELFAPEQIGSALLSSGAVFSQQHFANRLRSQSSQVHTAYIGDLNGKGIIFGIAGPDNVDTYTDIGDQFAHLVQQLRAAHADIASSLADLPRKLRVASPALVINRCSGRLIAANDAACRLLGQNERDIVGTEFSQVKLHLTPAMAGSKIIMENLQLGEICLSILTLAASVVSPEDTLAAALPNFLQCLRRTASALQLTSHHLESIVSHEPGHPEAELVKILDEEAIELDQTVRRFHLLAEYGQLAKQQTHPADELRQVIHRTATRRPERRLSLREHWESPVSMTVPMGSLTTLYDAILQIHMGQTCRCSVTDVVIKSDTAGSLTITFSTQAPTIKSPARNHAECIAYTTALASLMGVRLEHSDDATIETTLTYVEK